MPFERALRAASTHLHDYVTPYVDDLASVIDLPIIRSAGVRIGVDPLGGAGCTTGIRSSRGTESR
jgi:phosphoglucomutase